MRVLIQRVKNASVRVEDTLVGSIEEGLCIFLGVEEGDTEEDMNWICKKILGLRIFNDEKQVMNLSVTEQQKEILLISQFTLHANTKKGNRPSFVRAARPEIAEPIYLRMIEKLQNELPGGVSCGKFGAMMQVELCNDGPVTIMMDSKNKSI